MLSHPITKGEVSGLPDEVIVDEVLGPIAIASPGRISRSYFEGWRRYFAAFAYRAARRSYERNNPRLAMAILKYDIQVGHAETVIRHLFARSACRAGEEDLARSFVRRPLRGPISRGRLGSYFRRLGEIYCDLLDFKDAKRCLDQANQLLPGSVAVRNSFARYFLESDNDLDAALHAFRGQGELNSADQGSGGPASGVPSESGHDLPTPYDLVPYKSVSFTQTHPIALATVAMLVNHRAPPVEKCRVLELGCSSGGNLLPMAETLPGGEFLGIDASSVQVERGNEMRKTAGLTNVELRCQDILDFQSDPQFDYIICHGVYSWVPDDVKHKILDICRTCLSQNGIAYVSYNVFPKWRMNAIARDIMMYSSRYIKDQIQKLNSAKNVVKLLNTAVGQDTAHYKELLNRSHKIATENDDYYLIHEYLEHVNSPLHFHEFSERVQKSGLQYLGDADYEYMNFESVSSSDLRVLMDVSRDSGEVEQYKDFLWNRGFRRSLLCHAGCHLDRKSPEQRLTHFRVSSSARTQFPRPDLMSTIPVTFRFLDGGTISISDPMIKATLFHLGIAWPSSVPFVDLVCLVQSSIMENALSIEGGGRASTVDRLSRKLLRLFATNVVFFHLDTPKFVGVVSERPKASRLMQLQASKGEAVTNAKHESIVLDAIQCHLVAQCDGQRSVSELVASLSRQIVNRDIRSNGNNGHAMSAEESTRLASDLVPSTLKRLAELALFIS